MIVQFARPGTVVRRPFNDAINASVPQLNFTAPAGRQTETEQGDCFGCHAVPADEWKMALSATHNILNQAPFALERCLHHVDDDATCRLTAAPYLRHGESYSFINTRRLWSCITLFSCKAVKVSATAYRLVTWCGHSILR